jgi:hypothetical protein
MRLDPYNRIIKASKAGAGVHLTPDEVRALKMDGAIEIRAAAIENNRSLWLDQLRAAQPKPRCIDLTEN